MPVRSNAARRAGSGIKARELGGMEAILGRDTQSLKTMAELVSKLICDQAVCALPPSEHAGRCQPQFDPKGMSCHRQSSQPTCTSGQDGKAKRFRSQMRQRHPEPSCTDKGRKSSPRHAAAFGIDKGQGTGTKSDN